MTSPNALLPLPAHAPLGDRERAQWLRLRALRVERAQATLQGARAAEAAAREAVQVRRARIATTRAAMVDLDSAAVGPWAHDMPRWATTVSRHRDLPADRLERDEYALLDDERKLEAAQEQTRRAEAELARASARETAVQTLVTQWRRADAQAQEARTERDLEDRRTAPQAAA